MRPKEAISPLSSVVIDNGSCSGDKKPTYELCGKCDVSFACAVLSEIVIGHIDVGLMDGRNVLSPDQMQSVRRKASGGEELGVFTDFQSKRFYGKQ